NLGGAIAKVGDHPFFIARGLRARHGSPRAIPWKRYALAKTTIISIRRSTADRITFGDNRPAFFRHVANQRQGHQNRPAGAVQHASSCQARKLTVKRTPRWLQSPFFPATASGAGC